MLYIDYIVEWLAPESPATHLSFQVAPATLVFEEAIGIKLEMSAPSVTFGVALQILHLHRSPAREHSLAPTHHDYRIKGVDFELGLTAARFRQYFRTRPIPSQRQSLSVSQRGLPSFSTDTYD